jgi:hypothetical protein
MFELPPQHLVRLRTRADTLYVSQNRSTVPPRFIVNSVLPDPFDLRASK